MMKRIYISFLEANKDPLFFLHETGQKRKSVKEIIKKIRASMVDSHIFVYSNYLMSLSTHTLYFITPEKENDKVFGIFETCSYCNHGRNTIKKLTSFSIDSGIPCSFKFRDSFKGSFFNHELKIGYIHLFGVISVIEEKKSGEKIYGGADYSRLEVLAEYMKFRMSLIAVTDGEPGRIVNQQEY